MAILWVVACSQVRAHRASVVTKSLKSVLQQQNPRPHHQHSPTRRVSSEKSEKLQDERHFEAQPLLKRGSPYNKVLESMDERRSEAQALLKRSDPLENVSDKLSNKTTHKRQLTMKRGYPKTQETSDKYAQLVDKLVAALERQDKSSLLSRKKRVVATFAGRWPDATIHWEVNAFSYSASYKLKLRYVMAMFEYYTMIRFVEKTEDYDGSYASFKCTTTASSYVGFVNQMRIHPVLCCHTPSCTHEIGHLLGLMHEQYNPERKDHMEVNLDIIDPNWKAQYYMGTHLNLYTYGHFDYNSPMLYPNNWDSLDPEFNTYNMLDTDIDQYLSARPDFGTYWLFYYPAYEINDYYNVKGDFCSHFSGTCVNDGYLAYMDDMCQCRCPTGLSPATNCATKRTPDTTLDTLTWPEGTYLLPQSLTGDCPNGFEIGGTVKHGSIEAITLSSVFDAKVTTSSNRLTHHYCVRNSASSTATWDKGYYCTFKGSGDCPGGFEDGSLKFNDTTGITIEVSGTVPDGIYTAGNLTFKFCCRQDGYTQRPIILPTSKDFILFPVMEHCQEVEGMQARKGWYNFNPGGNSTKTGTFPDVTNKYRIHMCHYTRKFEDCGGIIDLTASTQEFTIQTPGYPNFYQDNRMCTWFISTPSEMDSKVLLTFHSFDISAHSSGTCTDYVEVRHGWVGNEGIRFCGSFPPHPYTSYGGYMAVYLYTDQNAGSSKGFTATVKLINEDDLCYKDQGRMGSYSGKVNVTRHNFPCVPWSLATKCSHHTFNEGDLDDDLLDNYCRNPGDGTRPWCYISVENCHKDFCDACGIEECRDRYPDCPHNCDGSSMSCKKECQFCDDSCYSSDEANLYAGHWKIAETDELCRPWSEFVGLDNYVVDENFPDGSAAEAKNYCRAPDGANTPWCYTSSDLYSDTNCAVTKCGETSTCADESTTCVEDTDGYRATCLDNDSDDDILCAKSCGNCPVTDHVSTCPTPPTISGTTMSGATSSYNLGDKITYTCNSNTKHKLSQWCSSSGTWKPDVNFVCGACPTGYDYVHGKCYRFMDDFVTFGVASSQCAEDHAIVASEDENEKQITTRMISKAGYTPSQRAWMYYDCFDSTVDDRMNFYTGYKSTTIDGTTCNKWTEPTWYEDSHFPDGSAERASNYCRNPVADPEGPWCFANVTFGWDYCGIPPCSGCLVVNGEGTVASTSTCSYSYPYVCVFVPSGREVCKDQDNDCRNKLEATPTMCSDYRDFAWQKCPRTCGRCSDSDPNAENMEDTCTIPSAGAHSTQVGSATSLFVGGHVEYKCDAGFTLTAGSLVRTCTPDGELSGNAPVCLSETSTDVWVNSDTEIRDRANLYKARWVLFSENQHHTINSTGTVTKWRFYARNNNFFSLVVMRRIFSKRYLIVGVNNITPQGDRVQTVNIPASEQISVQPGDLIGVHSEYDDSGVPYDSCLSSKNPSYVSYITTKWGMKNLIAQVGNKKPIKRYGGCVKISVSAFVDAA